MHEQEKLAIDFAKALTSFSISPSAYIENFLNPFVIQLEQKILQADQESAIILQTLENAHSLAQQIRLFLPNQNQPEKVKFVLYNVFNLALHAKKLPTPVFEGTLNALSRKYFRPNLTPDEALQWADIFMHGVTALRTLQQSQTPIIPNPIESHPEYPEYSVTDKKLFDAIAEHLRNPE